mmetsp:Transcript_5849/g.19323  ORF Transcript_5849/g.19323 Transcript_5849/m.19323 type:complete len:209 (-) Transcript_5849:104-730(-)
MESSRTVDAPGLAMASTSSGGMPSPSSKMRIFPSSRTTAISTTVALCCTEFSMDSLSMVVVSTPELIVLDTRPTCADATTSERSKVSSSSQPWRFRTTVRKGRRCWSCLIHASGDTRMAAAGAPFSSSSANARAAYVLVAAAHAPTSSHVVCRSTSRRACRTRFFPSTRAGAWYWSWISKESSIASRFAVAVAARTISRLRTNASRAL